MKRYVVLGVACASLAAVNGLVAHKEHVLKSGRTMLLRLAPVDPRSLIQGDYMVLRYDVPRELTAEAKEKGLTGGRLVVTLDADDAVSFVRVHGGEPLAENEHLLRYRLRGRIRLGAESFFFQEGHAKHYNRARFGELKVAPSGESVLVGLRGKKLQHLGPSAGEE